MKMVNVATLKNELSHWLRQVAAGEEIVVLSHRQAVAKLVPYQSSPALVIRPPLRPASHLKRITGVRPQKNFDVVVMLLEDRERR